MSIAGRAGFAVVGGGPRPDRPALGFASTGRPAAGTTRWLRGGSAGWLGCAAGGRSITLVASSSRLLKKSSLKASLNSSRTELGGLAIGAAGGGAAAGFFPGAGACGARTLSGRSTGGFKPPIGRTCGRRAGAGGGTGARAGGGGRCEPPPDPPPGFLPLLMCPWTRDRARGVYQDTSRVPITARVVKESRGAELESRGVSRPASRAAALDEPPEELPAARRRVA